MGAYDVKRGSAQGLMALTVEYYRCSSENDTLACLRAADDATLVNAESAISAANFLGVFTFVPVIDGTLIVDRPTEILKRNKVNGVRPPYALLLLTH